jgi:hypothetical protein
MPFNKQYSKGQLGRVVKAMDLKSIGVTRVSSNLTAVDTFEHLARRH